MLMREPKAYDEKVKRMFIFFLIPTLPITKQTIGSTIRRQLHPSIEYVQRYATNALADAARPRPKGAPLRSPSSGATGSGHSDMDAEGEREGEEARDHDQYDEDEDEEISDAGSYDEDDDDPSRDMDL